MIIGLIVLLLIIAIVYYSYSEQPANSNDEKNTMAAVKITDKNANDVSYILLQNIDTQKAAQKDTSTADNTTKSLTLTGGKDNLFIELPKPQKVKGIKLVLDPNANKVTELSIVNNTSPSHMIMTLTTRLITKYTNEQVIEFQKAASTKNIEVSLTYDGSAIIKSIEIY